MEYHAEPQSNLDKKMTNLQEKRGGGTINILAVQTLTLLHTSSLLANYAHTQFSKIKTEIDFSQKQSLVIHIIIHELGAHEEQQKMNHFEILLSIHPPSSHSFSLSLSYLTEPEDKMGEGKATLGAHCGESRL